MIPLRDSTKSESFPIITLILIAINIFIYFQYFFLDTIYVEQTFYRYGLISANLYYNNHFSTLFTYMFIHATPMHLIANIWILWLFGDNIEDKMGKFNFLVFYIICGILAGITHYLSDPNSYIPVVGASGAVAGVMGAYFLKFRHAKVLTFVPPFFLFNFPAWIYLGFWILTQLWCGAQELFVQGACGQIAFFAHIGGFIAGMILLRLFLKPLNR